LFSIFQLLQFKLVVHQMMSVLSARLVEIGHASTHVFRKTLAVLVPDVLYQTTRQVALVPQAQRVILSQDVFLVSSIQLCAST